MTTSRMLSSLKGGFVAVPVVLAAGHYHIPVIIHESDMTPGLANKICMRTAKKICCNFPETVKLLPADKAVLTGTPIRRELLNGSRDAGFAFTGLSDDKPILLMMGGSTGSRAVNAGLRSALPQLLKEFHVIHLCGKGNLDSTLAQPGYIQYEYISDELKDCLQSLILYFHVQVLMPFVSFWHSRSQTFLFRFQQP